MSKEGKGSFGVPRSNNEGELVEFSLNTGRDERRGRMVIKGFEGFLRALTDEDEGFRVLGKKNGEFVYQLSDEVYDARVVADKKLYPTSVSGGRFAVEDAKRDFEKCAGDLVCMAKDVAVLRSDLATVGDKALAAGRLVANNYVSLFHQLGWNLNTFLVDELPSPEGVWAGGPLYERARAPYDSKQEKNMKPGRVSSVGSTPGIGPVPAGVVNIEKPGIVETIKLGIDRLGSGKVALGIVVTVELATVLACGGGKVVVTPTEATAPAEQPTVKPTDTQEPVPTVKVPEATATVIPRARLDLGGGLLPDKFWDRQDIQKQVWVLESWANKWKDGYFSGLVGRDGHISGLEVKPTENPDKPGEWMLVLAVVNNPIKIKGDGNTVVYPEGTLVLPVDVEASAKEGRLVVASPEMKGVKPTFFTPEVGGILEGSGIEIRAVMWDFTRGTLVAVDGESSVIAWVNPKHESPEGDVYPDWEVVVKHFFEPAVSASSEVEVDGVKMKVEVGVTESLTGKAVGDAAINKELSFGNDGEEALADLLLHVFAQRAGMSYEKFIKSDLTFQLAAADEALPNGDNTKREILEIKANATHRVIVGAGLSLPVRLNPGVKVGVFRNETGGVTLVYNVNAAEWRSMLPEAWNKLTLSEKKVVIGAIYLGNAVANVVEVIGADQELLLEGDFCSDDSKIGCPYKESVDTIVAGLIKKFRAGQYSGKYQDTKDYDDAKPYFLVK